MNKYKFSILGLAMAVALSAFSSPLTSKSSKSGYFYFYTFTGAQTQAARSNGANYQNPQRIDPGTCADGTNECVLEVTLPGGIPPPNVSGLMILYNPITGIPDGGGNFEDNELEP